jgi:nanoRNase/pAp phosphatase (c-di-AMP/oligoRNAs hydrolase)
MTEYMNANGLKIDQRLATALYYAIKTDTLLIGRAVSNEGLRAFSTLWPKANHGMVSQMERPRMKSQDVNVFIRALKGHFIERGCLFAELGKVHREDIVPRIADFVTQIGEPEFVVAWGIMGSEITFASRSLHPALDSGEVMRGVFGHLGNAGGHRIMARATMPLSAFTKEFGAASSAKRALKKCILEVLKHQKNGGRANGVKQ